MYWILDVVFIITLIGGILLGVHRGFIAGICKVAGMVFSIFVAISFCNAVQVNLEDWFGMTSALAKSIGNETAAYWIAVAISFVILLIVVRFCAYVVGRLGTAVVQKVSAFNVINQLLGGLLGLLKSAVALFLVLTFCKYLIEWTGYEPMEHFISSSTIVGAIFRWDWFIEATTFSFLGFGK